MASLSEDFGMSLVLLGRLYRRELDMALKEFGLSEATALPLRYLNRMPDGCRQGELAEKLSIEGPTLVRVLDQLEAAGYVQRREDGADRRAKIVSLTGQGLAFHETLNECLISVRKRLLAGVSETELRATTLALDRILSNIMADRAEGIALESDK